MNSAKLKLFTVLAAVVLFSVNQIGLTGSAFGQSADNSYRIERFNISGAAAVDVATSGGGIRLVGSDTDEVRVEMYVRKGGEYLSPKQTDLKDWEIEISQRGNHVSAIARRNTSRRFSFFSQNRESVSFVIYAPVNTESDLRTSGGSLKLENLSGSQHARTSGGSISASQIDGDVILKTSGGSLSLEHITGNLTAGTSGGSIKAGDLKGAVELTTSGGSIALNGIAGNVKARTSGGSIKAEISEPGEIIDLRTSGGSVRIKVPKDLGFDLDLVGTRVNIPKGNLNGQVKSGRVSGSFNGGGTQLSARTSGGSVVLDYINF